jgi:hypothetical protein
LFLPSGALAANCDFTGSGSWHSSGNWSCAVVPDGDDSVTIGSGDAVTVGAPASAASLSLSAGTITVSSDSTLAVGGAMGVAAARQDEERQGGRDRHRGSASEFNTAGDQALPERLEAGLTPTRTHRPPRTTLIV